MDLGYYHDGKWKLVELNYSQQPTKCAEGDTLLYFYL